MKGNPAGMKLVSGGVSSREDGGRVVHFYAATMDDLTERLSMFSIPRKPIENRTGLTGICDCTIRQSRIPCPQPPARTAPAPGSPGISTPSAGHKEVDIPTDTIVIDHIEHAHKRTSRPRLRPAAHPQ